MEIRKSTTDDVPPPFWRSSGPPRRTWPPTATPPSGAAAIRGFPELLPDIAGATAMCSRRMETVVGTFSFIIGDEPTYQVLLNGRWHADRPYGTIHRLASSGTIRGCPGPVLTLHRPFRLCAGGHPRG